MIVYLDLIFFMNFIYDFLLLITVSSVLKRKRKIIYHFISAFVGALSVFLLFLNINNIILFLLKILISIIMCLVSFNYISLKYTLNNLLYLYMSSTILAGFLYLLNVEFSYDHLGIIFIFKGLSINAIILIIIAPISLLYYCACSKKLSLTYKLYYRIEIVFDEEVIKCLALFDSGNSLKDPITKKSIIIVNKKKLLKVYNIRDPIYVPYQTINNNTLMECFKPDYIIINNQKTTNYLVGSIKYKFKDGVDALLNVKLMEDGYV